jgi:hypothetical protein
VNYVKLFLHRGKGRRALAPIFAGNIFRGTTSFAHITQSILALAAGHKRMAMIELWQLHKFLTWGGQKCSKKANVKITAWSCVTRREEIKSSLFPLLSK